MTLKNTKLMAAALSVVALGLIALVLFNIHNIRKQNEETSRLLLLADEAASESSSIQSIRSLQNTAREDIEEFEAMVITEDKLVSTIEMMENAGARLGLKTDTVSVQNEAETTDAYYKVNLTVETEGEWDPTLQFLKALESMPTRILMDEVHFQKEEGVWLSRIGVSLHVFK